VEPSAPSRPKAARPVTELVVTGTETRTPVIRRVRFASPDLSAFRDSAFTDRYVKLEFPQAPDDQAGGQPVVRTYTALEPRVDPETGAGTLAVDFVTHGDVGVAGPWAQRAEVGDRLRARGPGGAYAPDPAADWHLIAGDESAVPALGAALDALDDAAVARVVVLVDDADHEPALPRRGGAEVTFLHRRVLARAGHDVETALGDAVRALEWLPGRVHAFAHGEAHEVMHHIRPHLLRERGLAREQVSVSGYWRRGRTEEGFRAWKADLAAAEATRSGSSPGRAEPGWPETRLSHD
jgi:NADPH-dependent ferric siderophore reductase